MTAPRNHKKIWKYFAGVLSAGLILCVALLFWLPAFIERQLNQQDLGAIVKEETGGTFTSGKLLFQLWPTPHVVIPDGHIGIPGQISGGWRSTRVYPAFSTLLKGQFQISGIEISEPDVTITLPRSADRNRAAPPPTGDAGAIKRHLQEALAKATAILPDATVEIRNGRIQADELFPTPLQLDNFDLVLQLRPANLQIEVDCRSNVWKTLHLSGALDPKTLQGQLQLAINKFNPTILSQQIPLTDVQWEASPLEIYATANLEGLDRATGTIEVQIPNLLLERSPEQIRVAQFQLKTRLTYSPQGLRIDLNQLRAAQPSIDISGQAIINPDAPLFKVELVGRHLTIDPLRKATLALTGNDETAVDIFDVLRGGDVPWIRFTTQGQRVEDMGVFRNMTINGVVEDGRLFIPGADLHLTEVQGIADISLGVLKGDKLFATHGKTTGADGRLWLDLDQDDDVPFFLEIDVVADLATLPALLEGWVDDPTFKGEMGRIHNVSGQATGVLILDSRGQPLDVTVDVTSCRFDAEYDRLPAKLSITEGMVQYTADRIKVIQMSGQLDASVFSDVSAHVAFGDIDLIQVDHAAARIAINQIGPWLASYGIFDPLPYELVFGKGGLKLARLKMEGPLLSPRQWSFDTRATISHLGVVFPDLPAPVVIESARFNASDDAIEVENAHILMADADLAFRDARFSLEDYDPVAAKMTINGILGPVSEKWASDRIELGNPWRLKSPVALTDVVLAWDQKDEKTFSGQLTTGGGADLTLDLKVVGDQLQHQKLIIDDQDSHAELQAFFASDHLEIMFNGRVTTATIERMMQVNRYTSGRMEGQFSARIYPNQPSQSTVSGNLQAYNIHQPLKIAQTHHIEELSLTAQENQVLLTPAVLVVDGQTHRITGTIDIEDDGYNLDLAHTATNFKLSLPEASSPDIRAPESETFSVWNLPLRGRIISKLDSFTLDELKWSPFNGTVNIENKDWRFLIEDAVLCGIATTGNIRVTPDKTSITLVPEVQDKDINATMTCLFEKPDLIDGQFDLAGRLETQGTTDQLSQSVRGQMELNARDGRIYRFTMLSKTLAVVNITELVRGKVPDLMDEGFAYESIDIQVDIEESLLTIKQAVIDGASANIAGQGTVNLVTGETDMTILVAPLKTVDAIVRYTPVIGDWLGGTLISIPVRVSGAFSDPTVTPLSPTAVGSSLMNLMKRTVDLPVKLVEPLWNTDD